MGQTQQSVQFLAIGDWGMDTDHQKEIAKQMALISKEQESVDHFFVAALGDNFYETGVTSVDDPKWKEVFSIPFEDVKCPWYPVLGNHDWEGEPQAQIDFKTDPRWQMPSLYYTKVYGLVQLVFIDTTILCPEISNMYTGVEFSATYRDQHLTWLKTTLRIANSNNRWVIVFGHYPIHSGGCSGTMKEMLVINDLLLKYGVNVYIAGHDHSLQHLYDKNKKMHYLVSGSGCEKIGVRHRQDLTKYCIEVEGFMNCRISKAATVMNVQFVTFEGNIVYDVDILRNDR